MKRFYKNAEATQKDGAWTVTLDGRAVKTPTKSDLIIPTEALARAIAEEWQSQGDEVKPESMPQMTLCCTAIDRVAPNRDHVVETVAAYGGSDLLCYRAENPADLVALQQEQWQPILNWAATDLDAPLKVTAGIIYAQQPAESLLALGNQVAGLSDHELTALHEFTATSGSLVLGLAVIHGRLSAADIHGLSFLDEDYQARLWGRDEEAQMRRERLLQELQDTETFLALLRA